MRWLLDRRGTDAYRMESLGFGINTLTGNGLQGLRRLAKLDTEAQVALPTLEVQW